MTRLALTVGALLIAGPALAQGEPAGEALQLKVRPSGYDAVANEAQARQEKLLKRLEQSNHTFRSICINCGDGWKHQIYTPFNPLAALGRQPEREAGAPREAEEISN
jgi:hypothetical protein